MQNGGYCYIVSGPELCWVRAQLILGLSKLILTFLLRGDRGREGRKDNRGGAGAGENLKFTFYISGFDFLGN